MTYFHNESLRKKLYDYIKRKINSGELKPGDPINQKEIFDELEISRTPYRDCMIQLESEGLVKIIPCRGVVVRELSMDEIMDAQDVGAALEGMAYELAFPHARERCIPKLLALMERAHKCFSDDVPIPQDMNMEFHMLVLAQCPNRSIVEQIIKMRERLYDFPQRNLPPLLKWEKIFWAEHAAQIEILKTGTAAQLGAYMREVHWNPKGKYEYWETLFDAKHGTVKEYYNRRLLWEGEK
ncbi:MAG: GntR family transcriptional regulator [Cloacibacillus sp.]